MSSKREGYQRRYVTEEVTTDDLSELVKYLQSKIVLKPNEQTTVTSYNNGNDVMVTVGAKYQQYPKQYSLSLYKGIVVIRLIFQQVKVGGSLADPRANYLTTTARRVTSNRKVTKQGDADSVVKAKKIIDKFVAVAQQS